MNKQPAPLTPQELEIMKVLWEREPCTVRNIYEALSKRRQVAYTTVMTMMNILEQKGHLNKQRGEKAFVYQSAKPREQVIRSMVREFVDRVFNGASEPLLVHLVEDEHLTTAELDEIRASIDASKADVATVSEEKPKAKRAGKKGSAR